MFLSTVVTCRICVTDYLRLIIFLNVMALMPVMCSSMLICQCCFAIVKVLLKKVTYLLTAAAGAGLLPSISSLRHVDLMSDSVTLEWEPATVIEPRHRLKSYVVERYLEEPPPPRWERLAALPITVTRYTVPGLSPGRRYKFRVFAETQEGLTGSPYEYEPPQYAPHLGGTY